ncbi:hypothetical protein HDU93_009190, partial [Gonapodya sp. JEL0774]
RHVPPRAVEDCAAAGSESRGRGAGLADSSACCHCPVSQGVGCSSRGITARTRFSMQAGDRGRARRLGDARNREGYSQVSV